MSRDKFDAAIDHLTKNPQEIFAAWATPQTHKAGCLFALACPDGNKTEKMSGYDSSGEVKTVGCLTQIREDPIFVSAWSDLTQKIRADDRIPLRPSSIQITDLPVFAEYQREMAARGPGDLVLTDPKRD